eukprot:455587-Hanusia_phi.AAC.2
MPGRRRLTESPCGQKVVSRSDPPAALTPGPYRDGTQPGWLGSDPISVGDDVLGFFKSPTQHVKFHSQSPSSQSCWIRHSTLPSPLQSGPGRTWTCKIIRRG